MSTDASEPDIFDSEEYVGVNDEHLFTTIPCSQPPPPANYDEPDDVATEGANPLEAYVDDADPVDIRVLHDPENP